MGKRSLGITLLVIAAIIGLPGCDRLRPRAPLTQSLNSRFNDEQPSLSGDGRWLALVSNRNGSREILIYDLRSQTLVTWTGLNQANVIAESPSLRQTGRYLVYLSSVQGRPDIALYDRVTRQNRPINPQLSPMGAKPPNQPRWSLCRL